MKRGDIFYTDLSSVAGNEQGDVRLILIVQNDIDSRHSPTTIATTITPQTGKVRLPTRTELSVNTHGLPKESVVLLEQIQTLDKRRLGEHMGRLNEARMQRVDNAIAISFGLHTDAMV